MLSPQQQSYLAAVAQHSSQFTSVATLLIVIVPTVYRIQDTILRNSQKYARYVSIEDDVLIMAVLSTQTDQSDRLIFRLRTFDYERVARGEASSTKRGEMPVSEGTQLLWWRRVTTCHHTSRIYS